MADKGLPFGDHFALPTAVLLRDELEHNLATMADWCRAHGVLLAPHGKTTMSPQIVRRQLAHGAWAVTVATAWQANEIAPYTDRIVLANQVVDPGSLALLRDLLARRPSLELLCYADSEASLLALEHGVGGRVGVLVELGVPGGRTGLRDDDRAVALAEWVAAGPLSLAGVAAFEGILPDADQVDGLLRRLDTVARTLEAPLVTVGGSAFFDRVAAVLAGGPYQVVLRSGCYVTHDSGTYDALSPLGSARAGGGPRLRPALQVLAPVLSRPEPGRALLGAGRRDVSSDAGLPVPLLVRGTGRVPRGWSVVALNDQHAYVDLPPDDPLAVGDVVALGISHPCTTFDKWRSILVVDRSYQVVDIVTTRF